MRTTPHLCLVALVAAACNEQGSTGDVEIIDNRDGVYDYVLGVDEDGNKITGGAHKVASFDDAGMR